MRTMAPDELKQLLDSVSFMALPNVKEPYFVARLADDRMFVITTSKYGEGRDKEVFLGTPGAMEKLEAGPVRRMRDGGTTTVETSAGRFYTPSHLRKGEATTFNGQPATLVSTEDKQLMNSLGLDFGSAEACQPRF